jgi:hypothetical protein
MKIRITERTEDAWAAHDYRNIYSVHIDGAQVFRVSEGEPKHSRLSKGFKDVKKIPELLRMAYESGKAGESFSVEMTTSGDI